MKEEDKKINDARSFLKSHGINKFSLISHKCGDDISFQEEGSPLFVRLEAFKQLLALLKQQGE